MNRGGGKTGPARTAARFLLASLLASSWLAFGLGACSPASPSGAGAAGRGDASPREAAAPAADAPAPDAGAAPAAAPLAEDLARALGPAPRRVAEPVRRPDRTSPRAVVRSLEGAVESRDPAALARLLDARKPFLDEEDLAQAERQFLRFGRDRHWRRVLAALDPGELERILESGAAVATVQVEVGGALGQVPLTFERSEEGAWTLRP